MANAAESKQVQVPSYLKISKVILAVFYFYIMLGIVSLTLRIFLLLFSANSSAGFYKLVMNASSDYLQPFRGIFPPKTLSGGGYFDVSSLFAIVVYLFIIWGVRSLVDYVQNKIDITKATQEKELAEIKRQKELSTVKVRKVVYERPARAGTQPRRT